MGSEHAMPREEMKDHSGQREDWCQYCKHYGEQYQ